MLIALALATAPAVFPEQVPGMIEACLAAAVRRSSVTETEDSHKYICNGEPAQRLWAWLEAARLPSWEQDVPEGRWLSRSFPLGGCFRRVRDADGSAPTPGLSCTIWIPRPATVAATPSDRCRNPAHRACAVPLPLTSRRLSCPP